MAVFHGKAGKINFDSKDIWNATNAVTDWTLSITAETAEASAMGDSWVKRLAGLTDFTATVNAKTRHTIDYDTLITGSKPLYGASATLKLYLNATKYFQVTAICSGVSFTNNIGDVGTSTLSFEGNSATGVSFN